MEIEKQVCTLEQAKELKKLGMPQESLFCWYHNHYPEWQLREFDKGALGQDWENNQIVSAFTISELADKLPMGTQFHNFNGMWYSQMNSKENPKINQIPICAAPTAAESQAKLLIYLLKNKILNLEK